jgi:hypothetical protein
MHAHYDENKIYAPVNLVFFFLLLIEYTNMLSNYDHRTFRKGRD